MAIDLSKRRVTTEVVAKYIENLRNSALDRLSGDSLKRFFTLDVALFSRAGGIINANGDAVGEKFSNAPAAVINQKQQAVAQKVDRKANKRKFVEWPFKDSTCRDYNSAWMSPAHIGLQQVQTSSSLRRLQPETSCVRARSEAYHSVGH